MLGAVFLLSQKEYSVCYLSLAAPYPYQSDNQKSYWGAMKE